MSAPPQITAGSAKTPSYTPMFQKWLRDATAHLTCASGVRPLAALSGINFHELGVGFAAAITIMLMPFSFSITDGIAAGFIFFVVIRIFQRQAGRVHPLMYGAAGAFVLYFLLPLLQQEFSWI